MAPDAATMIIGLVDAGGSAGGSVGQSDQWRLIFHLAGWRHPGSEVVVAGRRCLLPVSRDDLRSLMDIVGPYAIIEAEIEDGSNAEVTNLRRIVKVGVRDPELEQLARTPGLPTPGLPFVGADSAPDQIGPRSDLAPAARRRAKPDGGLTDRIRRGPR